MKTVALLKESVSGLLTGTNLNNVTALNGGLERAARAMSQFMYVPEASGRQAIILYDRVYDYAADATIFGGEVTDFRPQGVTRTALDEPYKTPPILFDQTKMTLPNGIGLTFEYDQGTAIVRVSSTRTKVAAVLDPMSDTAGWANGGSAGTISEDETVFYESPASLRFTLTGASLGTLTKTLSQSDLSSYQGVGVVFLAIETPSASDLTSIAVRLGSSASAYTEVSATAGFLGAWKANKWTVVALDLSTGTDTGTPDYTAIDYAQIRVTHGATLTNFRVGGFWVALPSPHEMLFQSAAIFMASGSNPSTTITDDNDSIILNDAAYVIYEYLAAKTIAMQMSGGKYTTLIQGFDQVLFGNSENPGLIPLYRADNPTQELQVVGSWY